MRKVRKQDILNRRRKVKENKRSIWIAAITGLHQDNLQ